MKRRELRKWEIWIIGSTALIVVLLVGITLSLSTGNHQSLQDDYQPWIIGASNPTGAFEETVTVPVNSEIDIVSKREYTGLVSIIIRGEGHLDRTYIHDAFYAYKSPNGTKNALNSLSIDGREYPSEFFVERPRYRANHEYGIIYPVGKKFRTIHFRIANKNSEDKSQFTVVVSVRNIVGGEGR